MTWLDVRLNLKGNPCPILVSEGSPQVRCLHPGDADHPLGYVRGPITEGWEVLSEEGDERLARNTSRSCGGCPISDLPEGVLPLEAKVGDHVETRVLVRDAPRLRDLIRLLRTRDQAPRLLSIRPGEAQRAGEEAHHSSDLTTRQREILTIAKRLGYLEPGSGVTMADIAEEAGCATSTAHEHLRKGLDRVLTSFMGTGAP